MQLKFSLDLSIRHCFTDKHISYQYFQYMSDRHILFILDYFRPYIGGIETLFYDLTQDLVKNGYEVTVITSRHDTSLQHYAKQDGVKIIRVGKSRWSIISAVLFYALRHRSLLQTVDHIHTSTFAAGLVGWLIAKIYKKPITITIHEIYDIMRQHLKPRRYRIYMRYERLICRLSRDRIVAVSQYTKDMIIDLHGVHKSNITVIHNQIDTTIWNPATVTPQSREEFQKKYNLTDCLTYLFVGRLGYEKGLPYLLEARDMFIKQNNPNAKLIIVAPQTPRHYTHTVQQQIHHTQRLIKDNNLQHTLLWMDPFGHEEALRVAMASSDIGIVPSMSEWFCYTAVQMQVMWLSLIASEVWALSEVLHRDHTLFVPYGKIQALYQALVDISVKRITIANMTTDPSLIDYDQYRQLFW